MAGAQISRGADLDIAKLAQGADRAQVALEALKESTLTAEQVEQLKALLKSVSPTEGAASALQVAQEMVDSYSFDKKTGVSSCAVPAGVTDVEAMKALNEYFRKRHPSLDRDAVHAVDFEWYHKLPQDHWVHCQERSYSQARQITITGVVEGTTKQDRATQEGIFKNKSLVFCDPRDQAIAAAIHACKHKGEDLFKGLWVRGCVPGFALNTNQYYGIYVRRSYEHTGFGNVAASGTLSPELT
jgi:hypothetical protein